jgi:uncharacterized protein YgiM (DUF1202 family)
MKTNCWLILGTMLATTAVAQVNTNKLPEIPPPAVPTAPVPAVAPAPTQTSAPAKKTTHAKKKTVKKAKVAAKAKKASESPMAPVTLVAGPATVAAEHVNLRGQAGLKGEVMGHVQKGDAVTVISEITLDKPKAGEPAQWAKIALPTGTKVWVDSKYIEASNNVVSAKKLNLRGGPGENYSVLGVIEKGTAITPVTTKSGWIQIEPPASAFAFVAAGYLKQEAGAVEATPPAVANTETVPPPPPAIPETPATVAEPQPIAPPATTPPPTLETPAPVTPPTTTESVPPPTPTVAPAILPQPTLAPDDTNLPPPPPRVVTHEGTVRHSVSPVSPTDFELYDPSDNKAINYLYTTSTNLNLGRYNGLHITVTGEEGLDVRWKDTPVLTIQKIYVLSDDKPKTKRWWSK